VRSRLLKVMLVAFASVAATEARVPIAHAEVVVCGDATGDGEVRSADALFTLQGAVGTRACPPVRCDCNKSGKVTATDATTILRRAVGVGPPLQCPPDETPTTTTSTTSTTSSTVGGPATCGNDELEDGEDCEPPFSFCRGGCNPWTNLCIDLMCSDSCACEPARCGDGIIDAGEDCDPPGSPCATGTCGAQCGCGN
jgi:hypothetical protein